MCCHLSSTDFISNHQTLLIRIIFRKEENKYISTRRYHTIVKDQICKNVPLNILERISEDKKDNTARKQRKKEEDDKETWATPH